MITVPVNCWTKGLLCLALAVHAYWAWVGLQLYAGIWTAPVMLVALGFRLWIVFVAGVFLYALVHLGWGPIAASLLATPAILAAFWRSWRPYVRFEKA